jgi:hypothetical protein
MVLRAEHTSTTSLVMVGALLLIGYRACLFVTPEAASAVQMKELKDGRLRLFFAGPSRLVQPVAPRPPILPSTARRTLEQREVDGGEGTCPLHNNFIRPGQNPSGSSVRQQRC